MTNKQWQFWIDRGGTFTDVIGKDPSGKLAVCKLLSENPSSYKDAAVRGIQTLLNIDPSDAKNSDLSAHVHSVKMGTTVATNALLERQGEPTVLVITDGFKDALRIGYQNRPDLFKLNIELPSLLYSEVIEVKERLSASGEVITPIDQQSLIDQLQQAWQQGFRSCAIVFMHGYRYHQHEIIAAQIARQTGFTQVSVSHQVSPLMKLIGRGDTTVVDSYLSPVLRRYIDQFVGALGDCQLQFMQSNGGLTQADSFAGKDAVLSGPAGGVVAMVETAKQAGINAVIGLDMGGTSTDVTLYNGEYERTFDTEVAGVRIQAPMMKIHTVAAGGGSILTFDGDGRSLRLSVGPESAGANPGPTCYHNEGPLTVTDVNVLLGKLQSDFFPAIFGPDQQQSLDQEAVTHAFDALAKQIHQRQQSGEKTVADEALSPEALAQGYLQIAVEHMANAIKHISVQRGIDAGEYTLCCFGGAGGQHACLVADALGIKKIFVHQLSGVLSAYGMGLAQVRVIRMKTVESALPATTIAPLNPLIEQLNSEVSDALAAQGFTPAHINLVLKLQIKYQGTDTSLSVTVNEQMSSNDIKQQFASQHQSLYGFTDDNAQLIVESAQVEGVASGEKVTQTLVEAKSEQPLTELTTRPVYFDQSWQQTPFYPREHLTPGMTLTGPAIIIEQQTTIVMEPNWQLEVTTTNDLVLSRSEVKQSSQDLSNQVKSTTSKITAKVNPIRLELFNNLFMFIADQMGIVLKNTATSVNIKERLDFSCALFNHAGELVANAPHMPVHLGSMGESVISIASQNQGTMQPGDVYLINSPYHGGSHLPDLTVITPVFTDKGDRVLYYVASRGHHADIGGLTPGSMPPGSSHIDEEGIVFENFLLVRNGVFNEPELVEKLTGHQYPARNISHNIADLKAQIAANQKGINELEKIQQNYGPEVVSAYMQHMIDAAEYAVKEAIGDLSSGSFTYPMDDGCQIKVTITINKTANHQSATVDFSGTSDQQLSNFNAPLSICKAAVLYVFRTLVAKNIPLNAGCLKPITLIVPPGCMLNPQYPAAVVAGNVETSQVVTDALYGALNISAGAQGTMNNFTFGNQKYQYYETICGGTGAGQHGEGCDAIHSHMTNSRLTDPEVLEWRYPVTLESFSIRADSAGQGKFNGGNGVVRKVRFEQPMDGAILSNHRKVAPFGLNGGEPGKVGCNYVIKADGQHVQLDSCEQYALEAGDTFVIETPGGGGVGLK
ncbi:MAG: 5-oxoprolinase (ATP-hydrolyzing) [Alteromonadaceae bacterium]|jgi:5-oxoprolinase (ATP-hydrolysing)